MYSQFTYIKRAGNEHPESGEQMSFSPIVEKIEDYSDPDNRIPAVCYSLFELDVIHIETGAFQKMVA